MPTYDVIIGNEPRPISEPADRSGWCVYCGYAHGNHDVKCEYLEACRVIVSLRQKLADTIAEVGRLKAVNAADLNKLAEAIALGTQQAAEFDAEVALIKSQRDELAAALGGIMGIGKRDMSNEKYDLYFEMARAALARLEKEGE